MCSISPQELAYYDFNDKRLLERFELIMTRLLSGASKSFPDLFGSKAELKGFYRFIENSEVTQTGLLSAHRNYTIAQLNHHQPHKPSEPHQPSEPHKASQNQKPNYHFVLDDTTSMDCNGYQKKG